MFVETFITKLAVEALDKGVRHRLPRLNELQMYTVLRPPCRAPMNEQCGQAAFRCLIQYNAPLHNLYVPSTVVGLDTMLPLEQMEQYFFGSFLSSEL